MSTLCIFFFILSSRTPGVNTFLEGIRNHRGSTTVAYGPVVAIEIVFNWELDDVTINGYRPAFRFGTARGTTWSPFFPITLHTSCTRHIALGSVILITGNTTSSGQSAVLTFCRDRTANMT
jgi:hypothetical protein